MNLIIFLTLKFLKGTIEEKNISFLLKVSFFSIFISSFALTIVTAIMNGFQYATQKKLQGIHSDIIIKAPENLNFKLVKNILNKNFKDSIKAISPSNTTEVIVQSKDNSNNLVFVKGIDPNLEPLVSLIEESIVKPKEKLNKLLKDNNIIIGKKLAQELNVKIDDTVFLLIPSREQIQKNKIILDNYKVKVSGFFSTGIEEFDEHAAYISLKSFDKIFDKGINQVNLKLKNNIKHQNIINKIKKVIPFKIYSWKELYPAVVSALNLEKYAMMIILIIIILIAGVNLISLIFIYTIQKQREIAILQAMGLSYKNIVKVFGLLSTIIIFSASFLGLLLGIIISLILEKFPIIKLPDAYYISYLPAKLNFKLILIIFLILLIIGLLISLLSIKKIKNINISFTLKQS